MLRKFTSYNTVLDNCMVIHIINILDDFFVFFCIFLRRSCKRHDNGLGFESRGGGGGVVADPDPKEKKKIGRLRRKFFFSP